MIDNVIFSDIAIKLLIASALGAFLGVRREMEAQHSEKHRSFMGLRTMTLLCLMGAFSTLFPLFPNLPLIFFGGIVILVSIAYAYGSFHLERNGLTTEFTAMIVFWIGVLVGVDKYILAILMTLFLAGIHAYKESLHGFVKTLNQEEWSGALQLLLISGAILPFLPKTPIDPWGAIVPFNVWFLVVLISGIGFLGYFLTKYFGARGGIPLASFFGAIVSSTAVTIAMASRSKDSKLSNIFAGGIMIALATMQIRVIGEVYFLGTSDMLHFLLVPLAMAGASLVTAIYFFSVSERRHGFYSLFHNPDKIKLDSPFEIGPAIKFGLVFVLVLIAIVLGKKYFGTSGVYTAAIFSGIIDIDSIVLSSLESVKHGQLASQTAQNSVLIALFVNTVVKIAYGAFLGSFRLIRKMALAILFVALVGGGVYFLI